MSPRYTLPPDPSAPPPLPRSWRWHLRWLIPLLALDAAFLLWWLGRARPPADRRPAAPDHASIDTPAARSPFHTIRFPTDQDLLQDPLNSGVFQSTASGKPESALFGSVRTTAQPHGLASRFHEGVDIAAMRRDARGRPLDTVHAIAEGTVAYINHVPGISEYGRYVVLIHPDRLGAVYTLYAHLSSTVSSLRPGDVVEPGASLGVIGNSSLSGIPLERAHLHFEIGLLLNPYYDQWIVRHKAKRPGALYNGLNLFGIDPIGFFRAHRATDTFDMAAHLAAVPEAFRLVYRGRTPPPFFSAYPLLWDDGFAPADAVVVSASESGLPLRGRYATESELARIGSGRTRVLAVDEAVLGRNGRRHVARRGSEWALTTHGQEWLELLTFQP
jgi:murein DD-endopeptidase MepM/ murein hydrolase activator NlpD